MKFFLTLCALLFACFSTQAYIIYNNTDEYLHVVDRKGFFGYAGLIPAHGSAACDSQDSGCRGKIRFLVDDPSYSFSPLVCQWEGTVVDSLNQYFTIDVINPDQGGKKGWCQMLIHP